MQALPGQPALPFLDPEFDQEAFREEVKAAFYTIKRAWADLDAAICRHRMSDDLWERQAAAMEAVRLDGCRTVVEGISVIDVQVLDSQTVGSEDQMLVGIDVAGTDCVVREATGEVVRGSRVAGDWRETWVLRRSRDAGRARLIKCPGCGSPLELNDDGRCAFCNAVVPGARDDWLVSDMTRGTGAPTAFEDDTHLGWRTAAAALAGEVALHPWLGHDPGPLPVADAAVAGVIAIGKRDPGFLAGDFLAYARGLFLKIDAARNEMAPELVRAFVGDAFYLAEQSRAEQSRAEGRNRVEAFLDVSGVSLERAAVDGGREEITVRVSATSAAHVIDLSRGVVVSGTNTVVRWTADLAFERAAGAVSSPLRGAAGGFCPNCQAADDIADDGHCRACGEHVTGGEYDWVLTQEVRSNG